MANSRHVASQESLPLNMSNVNGPNGTTPRSPATTPPPLSPAGEPNRGSKSPDPAPTSTEGQTSNTSGPNRPPSPDGSDAEAPTTAETEGDHSNGTPDNNHTSQAEDGDDDAFALDTLDVNSEEVGVPPRDN